MALRDYNEHASQPQGILPNMPVELACKDVLIDIEVVNDQLDYNLLLGRSCMHAMKVVSSTIFWTMMFPSTFFWNMMFLDEENIVKIVQLTYYGLKRPATPEKILPMVDNSINNASIPSLTTISPSVFKEPPMTTTFLELPPPSEGVHILDLCTLSSDIPTTQQLTQPQSQPQPIPTPALSQLPDNQWGATPIQQIPFLFMASCILSTPIMETLKFHGLTLGLLVWYLTPLNPPPTP